MAAHLQTIDRSTPISAPVSGWRRLLADWAVVGSVEVICQALGTVTSLLLRMLLSPAQMGIWQAVKLVLSYASYANLGVSKGAARELTVALGRGDLAKAQRGLDLAFTTNILSSLAYAAVLAGAGIWVGLRGTGEWSSAWAAGLAIGGLLAALGRYASFQVTVLRAKQAFATTSRLSALEAVTTLVVGGACTWLWGLPGLYAGTLGVMGASLVYLSRFGKLRFSWAWDRGEMRRLIAIGSPILLAGVVYSLFRSLDKLMILAYMPDREFQLGCYSLALMVSAQLYGIGNMLSIVMGPRYGEKFGQCGDRRQVALLAARATELQATAMALPAALALVLAGPVLGRMLPDYETGLAPLVWLVPGMVLLSLSLPASQYLVAIDRQKRALAAVLAAA
ncbi:MAG: oligosaccharide flippase family protein, partial [Pirellulales bacterium]|nr:oligosaccharide flippase family protein [Pirellulales bacterium]